MLFQVTFQNLQMPFCEFSKKKLSAVLKSLKYRFAYYISTDFTCTLFLIAFFSRIEVLVQLFQPYACILQIDNHSKHYNYCRFYSSNQTITHVVFKTMHFCPGKTC